MKPVLSLSISFHKIYIVILVLSCDLWLVGSNLYRVTRALFYSLEFQLKVSDIAMLDKLEGGLVTESEDGLAVMFVADSDIESKLTDTLRAHLPAWKRIGAGVFATCTVHLFC